MFNGYQQYPYPANFSIGIGGNNEVLDQTPVQNEAIINDHKAINDQHEVNYLMQVDVQPNPTSTYHLH